MAMADTAVTRPLLDLTDPRFLADPYPFYRLLRERAPVWRSPTGLWVLSRYADIAAVSKDPRFGHDFEGKLSDPRERNELLDEPVFRGLRLSMLVRDPPDHTRLRGLVVKAFTARRLEEMRPKIEALVKTLLDKVEPQRRMDVIGDFARPLPVLVICELLGIPEEDRPRFLSGYKVSGRALDPTPMTREELDEVNAIAVRNRGYFEELFERRRDAEGEDLISALLHVRDEHDGRLTHDELAANIGLLFGAGHETTTHLIGNGLLALHRNPEQWRKLVADPTLAGQRARGAAALRFLGPAHEPQGIRGRHACGRHHRAARRERHVSSRRRQPRSGGLCGSRQARHHAQERAAAVVRRRHPPLPRRAARADRGRDRVPPPGAAAAGANARGHRASGLEVDHHVAGAHQARGEVVMPGARNQKSGIRSQESVIKIEGGPLISDH